MESLVWVVVDGRPQHVSSFADLAPMRRPRATCPVCARRLTLKLGAVRRHHAAHASGDACSATAPETALHVNTKLALAAALQAASGELSILSILLRCAGAGAERCDETSTVEWLHGWDEVAVERRIPETGQRRPDILLRRCGGDVAAVEVVASNAVSVEKAAALADAAIPWIEVEALEALAAPGSWTPRDPLAVLRSNAAEAWRCDTHRRRQTRITDDAAARRADAIEAARHTTTLSAARVVDVYHPDGARDRFIYLVHEHATEGRVHSVSLRCGGREVLMIQVATDENLAAVAAPRIRAAFRADVDRYASEGAFTDSPMRWAHGDTALGIVEQALIDRVGPDPTPLARTYPRRWFFARESRRWFLARELRDIRWDRPSTDIFAWHPAWRSTRDRVRERPAPEGSWNTPVFAARPIAAMFRNQISTLERDESGALAFVSIPVANASAPRVIVVVEHRATTAAIERLAAQLDARGVDAIWMSHPLEWNDGLSRVPWVLAGRDARGRGGIVIDGVGVFTADQFARAVAKNDRRLRPDELRRRMADRVQRFLDAAGTGS